MASKPTKSLLKLETDVDKNRSLSNWRKLLDIAAQISSTGSKTPGIENVAKFLNGEAQLEQYLEEFSLLDDDVGKATSKLSEPKRLLIDVLKGQTKPIMWLECNLLLAKVAYAVKSYDEALSYYDKVGLEDLTVDVVSHRFLRLLAEGYIIKAFCLEKVPLKSSSKFTKLKRDDTVLCLLERGGDLALVYLQDEDKMFGSSRSINQSLSETNTGQIGELFSAAMQRAPLLRIRHGEMSRGIGQYRRILKTVESKATQSIRQCLATQLAEVLLRGVTETSYHEIETEAKVQEGNRDAFVKMTDGSTTSLIPREYKGERIFKPETVEEEILLLLLISEATVTREAVLSRAPEFHEQRIQSMTNCLRVYDLLTVLLVRRVQFQMLCDTFERALKFSLEEFHIWFQFALALICNSKHKRALLVLKECMNMNPADALVPLYAAKLCLQHLHKLDEGIRYAHQAISIGENSALCHKAYLVLGIGYSMKADEAHIQTDRQSFQKKALDAFYKAHSLDPGDHLCEFYIAFQHAIARQIPQALEHVRTALDINSEHIHSLHLLALLLSANKHYRKALQVIALALNDYPDDIDLMFTKVSLEEHSLGVDEALSTCKYMLFKWREDFEVEMAKLAEEPAPEVAYSDIRSTAHLTDIIDRDSGSVQANSLAASRVEHALSEVVSSMTSYTPKTGPHRSWLIQAQIWMQLGELYLAADQATEAQSCVQEILTIFPLSHLGLHMKGRIHEYKNEFFDAETFYKHATAINPYYVKSLQHLGLIHYYLGNNSMAEKVLRDAVKIDPTSHESWFRMGKVLEAKGDSEDASECLFTAIELEATCPVLPFTTIPRFVL